MLYNPVSGAWSWTNNTAINYALHAVKVGDDPHTERAEEEDHTTAAHSWASQEMIVKCEVLQPPLGNWGCRKKWTNSLDIDLDLLSLLICSDC